jgi:glycosyltransferase involved in cell wall biosynthesis
MTRSIHAIASPALGGAERFFARLVSALHEDGYPSMAVLRRGSKIAGIVDAGVPRVFTGMANSIDLRTVWRMRRLVAEHRPEIVQTYLGRATRLTRVPTASDTIHLARLGGYYRPRSYRHADAWVANTRGIRDYLVEQGFPAERVFHISNFAEAPEPATDAAPAREARERLGIPDDARMLFALGRFRPSKGFVELLDAFALLPREVDGRPLRLVIAGDGDLRDELRAQAQRLGIADRVSWTGWLVEPAPYYAAADLFICPSRMEHLGNVILEAWGRNVPVLSTRTRGAEELMVDGETGMLVAAGDARALHDGILRALHAGEPELRRLADAGLHTVRTRHSKEAIVAAYRELYAHLVTLGRRRR